MIFEEPDSKAPLNVTEYGVDGNAGICTDKYIANPDIALWDAYNKSIRQWKSLGRYAKDFFEDDVVLWISQRRQ